jgi:hypothetical protein
MRNGVTFAGSTGNSFPVPTGDTTTGYAASTGLKILDLSPGDTITLQGYCSTAWSTAFFTDAASYLNIVRID